ncbi:MAG: hypothetical protein FWF35_04665 [Elusimicrobia bacterium]|nr:hypothetical protein [Elusimicrobiota bacterium]
MRKLFLASCFIYCAVFSFAAAEGQVIKIPANSQKGFNWGYFLYLPKTMDRTQKQTVLITPCNTGRFTDDDAQTEEWIKEEITDNAYVYNVPDGLGAPMLMPIFPRYSTDRDPHGFGRDMLTIGGNRKRVDLQVLAMFKDAREQLKKLNIETNKKFFMSGFSAAGSFAEKFVIIHPKNVLAAASGGDVGLPTLPLKYYDGYPLIYAVGIFDLEKLTGVKFNLNAYRKVPQYIYDGADDTNDPFLYTDVYGPAEKGIIEQVLTSDIQKRWQKSQEIMNGLNANIQFNTYADTGHEPVNADVIAFLKANVSGKGLNKITPTNTAMPDDVKIKIEETVFGSSNLIDDEPKSHINPTDIVFILSKEQSDWSRGRYEKIRPQCPFTISDGKNLLFTTKECRGFFRVNDGRVAFHINIAQEDFDKMKKGVKYYLHPLTKSYEVNENAYLIKN